VFDKITQRKIIIWATNIIFPPIPVGDITGRERLDA
jgi:hypothetical protein